MSSYVTISHSELSLSRVPVLSCAHCSHCAKEWRRNLSDLCDDTLSRSAQLRFAIMEYYGFGAGAREPQVELSKWSCDF